MRKILVTGTIALLLFIPASYAQFINFRHIYPIASDANLAYKTSYVASETILFEANPTMRFAFYNNILKRLISAQPVYNKASSLYLAFKPQLRMYTDVSLPVKTPTYRIELGYQQLFKFCDSSLLSFALESGHYSNGQYGAAFSEKYLDGSPESDSIYKTITPATDLSAILNRISGNYSTNLTELAINYRRYALDRNEVWKRMHSFTFNTILYHDNFWGVLPFGGYSDEDIEIYGNFRFQLGYEYTHVLQEKAGFLAKGTRYALALNTELISGAHESVDPWRLEATASIYPVKNFNEFGFFVNYTTGHDNYNYRFVDAGSQFSAGLAWNVFPPIRMAICEAAEAEDGEDEE